MENEIKGRARGGVARSEKLTPERRKEISLIAVQAKKDRSQLPKTICGDESKRILIGNIEIQCYVLEDETRLLTLRSLQASIGLSEGGGKGGARKIPTLMSRLKEKGINTMDLDMRANNPIRFITPSGAIADGYDAKILPDICAVLINASQKGVLDKRINYVAERAAELQHGFATMGIIWLVDKVTGFDSFKKANDFARIIEAFVVKEIRPYVKKFPPEYYQEICRLRGIPYDPNSVKRPAYFGHLTNGIIYHRLAPGVWKEIKSKAKKESNIVRPHLHRYLTGDIGDPRLKEVIVANVTVMKLSDNWFDFLSKLDRVLPLYNQTLQLPFSGERDSGLGL